MAIGLAALGLLAFLLGFSGSFAETQNSERAAKCSLTGSWKNDLTSTMEINSVSNTGVFSGVYKTAVSDSGLLIRPSPLVGVQHLGDLPVFGFTVNWSFDGSTAVFAGQCLVDENGKELLKTTWLLRAKMGSTAEDWGATRVGTDTFYRIK
ncbi:avidin-related protein 4/5-like [Protobothrops mucrosquamatus]|uniref:avidin-related protein 4/5-like n=1 Tax=Protobothrops mucrosquamatus TaxID=103944 RepID=UPI0010FAD8E7|nr:avidin-related protein 4/5-like [Protobothrops mucrosquamatus]